MHAFQKIAAKSLVPKIRSQMMVTRKEGKLDGQGIALITTILNGVSTGIFTHSLPTMWVGGMPHFQGVRQVLELKEVLDTLISQKKEEEERLMNHLLIIFEHIEEQFDLFNHCKLLLSSPLCK